MRRAHALRVIRFFSQQGVEEGLSSWLLAAAVGLDGDEDSVDLGELLGIIPPKNPAPVGVAVHVQNAQIHGARFCGQLGIPLAPYLEGTGVLDSRLAIEIK